MKVCVAQMKPARGDIESNLARHCQFAEAAASLGAELLVFPELSLTGYEPMAARQLAMSPVDPRLEAIEQVSREQNLVIGVGLPTGSPVGTCVSMMIFRCQEPRLLYSKRYLHADERPFFVCGRNLGPIEVQGSRVAMAICFELSVARHAAKAAADKAEIYIASVAKPKDALGPACERLAEIAGSNSMLVLMSNSIGPCEGFEASGGSAAWNAQGELLGQLDEIGEGFLLLDTTTLEVSTSPFAG